MASTKTKESPYIPQINKNYHNFGLKELEVLEKINLYKNRYKIKGKKSFL